MKHQVIYGLSIVLLSGSILFSACKKKATEEPLPTFGKCQAVAPAGHLTYIDSSGEYIFRTNSGGTITVGNMNNIVIRHDDYTNFKIELWGDMYNSNVNTYAHENLNGKHIKDREGNRRTIVFPDGAKITIVSNDSATQLLSVTIYDGDECHYINGQCKVLEYSAVNGSIAQRLDDKEADGETGTFEITSTGLFYVNIYQEDTPGNKVMNRVMLAELVRTNPNNVTDYYDDPRLGHT